MSEPIHASPVVSGGARGTGPAADPSCVSSIVGEISGDRACATCGFNLFGQQIIREPHYGLLIVRCPECSTAAALQEYPSLGRWAGRLAFLAAALFVLAIVGGFIGTSALFSAIATEFDQDGVRKVADKIATMHLEYQNNKAAAAAAAPAAATTAGGPSGAVPRPRVVITPAQLNGWAYDQIEIAWWDTIDKAEVMKHAPVLWRTMDRTAAVEIAGLALLGASFGTFWSVLLCAVRRRRLWIFAFLVAGAASVFMILMQSQTYRSLPSTAMAMELAQRMMSNWGAWMVLGVILTALLGGLLAGRSIARTVVRWLVMPRHVGLFGFLWAADGLAMPRPGEFARAARW